MKTARLKNIVIMVLVLLNVFLLFLLLGRRAEERRAREHLADELTALYAASDIVLSPSLLPEAERKLPALEPLRDAPAEAAFANALLGPSTALDSGGGIHRYESESGECFIRASGTVEAAFSRSVGDVDAFYESFFDSFGYAPLSAAFDGSGTGSAIAVRTLEQGTVFNASLTLEFTDGLLTGASGFFLPAVSVQSTADGPDAVTALMRFLDYANQSGVVCTEVSGLEQGYLLLSSVSMSSRLVPVWSIETDVGNFYVNCVSGEIIRP